MPKRRRNNIIPSSCRHEWLANGFKVILVMMILVATSCSREEVESVYYPSYKPTIKALPLPFSVGPQSRVFFSRGNVQYQPLTRFWRTAEHQYTVVGKQNENIRVDYGGWIDLFGWGTAKHPTISDLDTNAYQIFADWGTKFGPGWRTLTEKEWDYMANYRADCKNLRSSATIGNTPGILFMPDGWTNTTAIPIQVNKLDPTANRYTIEQWDVLEETGILFLPATGWRHGHDVHQPESVNYWSSTSVGVYGWEGQRIFFGADWNQHVIGVFGASAYSGMAVRLVSDTAPNR